MKVQTKLLFAFGVSVMVQCVLLQSAYSQALTPKEARELQGIWNRAIANYQFAVQNNFAAKSSNFQAAIEDFTAVIDRTPSFAEAYFYRAAVYFLTRKQRDAFIDIREALKVNAKIAVEHPRYFTFSQEDSLGFEAMISFAAKNYGKTDSLLSLPKLRQHNVFTNELLLIGAIAKYNLGKKQEACSECQFAREVGVTDAEELAKQLCAFQPIVFDDSFPKHLQFFAREKDRDSAFIDIKGRLYGFNADSIVLVKYRAGKIESRIAESVSYSVLASKHSKNSLFAAYVNDGTNINGKNKKAVVSAVPSAAFALKMGIKAECAEYGFKLQLRLKNGADTIIAERDSLVAGDVYFFAGQSNMVLGNVPPSSKAEFMRTYSNRTPALWQTMSATNTFPNELGHIGALGGALARKIVEEQGIPVCAIHAAVSGTSLQEHTPTHLQQNNITNIYNSAFWLAKKSGLQKKIRGILWYQGESNTGLGYTSEFLNLCRFWQTDYSALERIFVVQIRPNVCNEYEHNDIREEQRRLPQALPIVRVIAANAIEGYDGCHFSQQGYERLADVAYSCFAHELYGSADTADVISPTVASVVFADSSKTKILVEFTPASSIVVSKPDSVLIQGQKYSIRDAFGVDGVISSTNKRFINSRDVITNVEILGGNRVTIALKNGVIADRLSYIPDKFYSGTTAYFVGPWLQTKRGVGVLSFYRVKINDRRE